MYTKEQLLRHAERFEALADEYRREAARLKREGTDTPANGRRGDIVGPSS
jgi:hypothetical protein